MRWIDGDCCVRTHLLALRHFDPSSDLRTNNQLSALVCAWALKCMEEFGLVRQDIAAWVTDSGSDVKRAVTAPELLYAPREWCGPHAFNRAIIAAAGCPVDEEEEEDDDDGEDGAGAQQQQEEEEEQDEDVAATTVRTLLVEIRKIITRIYKSPILSVRVRLLCIECML